MIEEDYIEKPDPLPLKPVNPKTVAIIDDEPDIVELVSVHLRKSGFRVKAYGDGDSLFKSLATSIPDIIILDLMLPDSDGFEICQYLKKSDKYSNIPIIMLTARTHETDKILGLELGADDYITKPFSPRELAARVKVVLRRENKMTKTNLIRVGDLEIDLQRYIVQVNGEKIDLTSTEFKILRLLSERVGWVYSREKILDHLGTYEKGVLDRTVDVHIKNLREKLKESGRFIKNIRGVGYKLADDQY